MCLHSLMETMQSLITVRELHVVALPVYSPPPLPTLPVYSPPPLPTAAFLANAINSGQFEAAHKMINMLQKMAQTKPGKKLVFSYVDGPDSAGEDAEIT